MTLTFQAMPLTTNSLYAHQGPQRFLTQKGKDNKQSIGWDARAQYRGKALSGPLAVEVSLFWPDKRKHDVDNIKALLDAGRGILWDDDSQITDLHVMKEVNKANPHAEMRVREL